VHEPAMQGEIRVTVIATGFDRAASQARATPTHLQLPPAKSSPVIPFPANRPVRVTGVGKPTNAPPAPSTPKERTSQDLSDMEIPTFIRRQMD
jgi:cell division protein FtsZ